jgi:hypothetical protein
MEWKIGTEYRWKAYLQGIFVKPAIERAFFSPATILDNIHILYYNLLQDNLRKNSIKNP